MLKLRSQSSAALARAWRIDDLLAGLLGFSPLDVSL